MRRFITPDKNKIGFNIAGLSFKNIIVREISPVDEFYFEKTRSSDDNTECIAFTDPIRMLFNQKRLASIGSTAIQAWLDSLKNSSNDPYAEIRSKCSDDELISLIKSRHIQQPCELLAYAEECKSNMESFTSELKQLAELRNNEIQQQANNTVVETSKSE